MHHLMTHNGNDMIRAALQIPASPDVPSHVIAKAEKMVINGTTVTDPGDDYCEFLIYDGEDKHLGTYRVDGY
jgi:hypothetical protein